MIPSAKTFIDDKIVKHCINIRASILLNLYITVLLKQFKSVVFKELL